LAARSEQLKELGDLVPWTVVFKRSHPGSLSHLRQKQREIIQQAIKDFLIKNISAELEQQCYGEDGKICIPESLIEPFQTWFDQKIDEGILDNAPKQQTPSAPNGSRRQSHASVS
jgi:hypothetical protein